MDLSNDLISKFVKITNDEGEKKSKESVVYGTTVEYDGAMYVRIDGSDLITPVNTTADIKPDERVTVMIKDHTATVTGNISDPSASSSKLGTLGSQISEFDIVIANKVSTELLEAEIAQIEILIADKADISELTAIKADIEHLNAENATIENLVANKADIMDLNATNANITNLNAEVADIRTLVNGNLTSDNIQSLNLTAKNTTIQNALIKDAMIDTVAANKIRTGVLDTNSVSIQSADGSMILTGSVQQFKDENGTVRIQIGKDGGGNFTFILYDETGKGILIDETGLQSSDAIADGLIVDAKVAENANISGDKLNISSVISEINDDNSTTIKSNKIYLNEQEQSLEVAFNSLKTKVDTIQDVTIDGDLSSIVEQVQSNTSQIEVNKERISTLIAEDKILSKEVSDLEGNILEVSTEMDGKFTALEQDLSGFKMTVNEAYASKKEVNDLENDLTTNYSTTAATQSFIDQKANEIVSSVSDTYATKQTVTDLNGKLLRDYSTTETMNSAIDQKANQITQSVSQTYTTKTEFNNLSIGGRNLVRNGKFEGAVPSTSTISKWTTWGEKITVYSKNQTETYTKAGCVYLVNTTSGLGGIYSSSIDAKNVVKGEEYTISFTFEKEGNVIDAVARIEFFKEERVHSITVGTATTKSDYRDTIINSHKFTMWDGDFDFIRVVFDHYGRFNGTSGGYLVIVGNVQLEQGNRVTAWKPAVEDTMDSIDEVSNNLAANYSTTIQMNSAIDQKANQITQSVSQTYAKRETVTDLANNLASNYSTTTQMNSAIDQKANQITQSVSQTYATRQSVTDLSNNLTTNYSTTSKMNSAIDQKANQIAQTVSETYTTKKEFDGLAIGGRNLVRNGRFEDAVPNTRRIKSWIFWGSTSFKVWPNNQVDNYVKNGCVYLQNTSQESGGISSSRIYAMDVEKGKQYTLSCTFEKETTVIGTNVRIEYFNQERNTVLHSISLGGAKDSAALNNLNIQQFTFTMWDGDFDHAQIVFSHSGTTNDHGYLITVGNVQLEKGNKATDWTPSLEDTLDATTGGNLIPNSSVMVDLSGFTSLGGTIRRYEKPVEKEVEDDIPVDLDPIPSDPGVTPSTGAPSYGNEEGEEIEEDIVIKPPVIIPTSSKTRIHFLMTVSCGDCILIETESGKNILIDAPDNRLYDNTAGDSTTPILKYLKEVGVNKLDYVVCTHFHSDHAGALPTIIETYCDKSCRFIYNNGVSDAAINAISNEVKWKTTTYKTNTLNAANKVGMAIHTLSSTTSEWTVGSNTKFKVYKPDNANFTDYNQTSLAVTFEYRDKKIFLGGDINVSTQSALAKHIGKCDVVKDPHHGYNASMSIDFVKTTNPKDVIVTRNYDWGTGYYRACNSVGMWQSYEKNIYTLFHTNDHILIDFIENDYVISTTKKFYFEKCWLKFNNDDATWCYFKQGGECARNETLVLDGKRYDFDSSGFCTNPYNPY